ncbi:hypothetical protein [Pseudodesulfovibrio tunisiensis]|uniref:hypothetical protein n=1 Tax=Pseudodesulfovibrio tunisiensis TaxID=463192 RepID=UPI001FB3B92F|nr:hypothetical protein [Pseudodesulfovibrio tunisiensis]
MTGIAIDMINPGMERGTNRIQELKARAKDSLHEALTVVEQNAPARAEAEGLLAMNLDFSGMDPDSTHMLNADRVADLISDPFLDEM